MKLIIGLGNPGKQYENTRHNAGFMVLDKLKESWGFPEFKFDKKFNAEISEGSISGKSRDAAAEKMILAKPQTFMNLSGDTIKELVNFYKIPVEDITIIHDDLDINLGEYKISTDASSGGHNGVQDIFDKLGTQKIKRYRIGIEGEERRKSRGPISGDVFVVQNFSDKELKETEKAILEVVKSLS
ncbi:MAG TPA: aminoacyl-tRNA hydrolase [Candidatus Moranbacteria bacterium]|jgi:PTH1 family peptidyl-tRNA hydrolase|nr:aminoacyl-tRNA hydrolase [Candidatus Moranbacteria bacterium]HOF42247.1 aminoacyl-tRNA hydrolase [Candidatus Moranbacteria bacterium]HPX94353.1 aminoacyl-tRNA hydrolase [Candidatus Moranbacteria bacterium]HQB59482.1 aminoacyl-tRNA hydrolase [Candidatus Moranbacteria bacterium]